MNIILEDFQQKSISMGRTIVLPEGEEPRTIEAAAIILNKKIAKLIMLGDEKKIKSALTHIGADTNSSALQLINPVTHPNLSEYTAKYYEMRKSKGMTEEEAEQSMKNNLFFGAMLVREGAAHGSLAGAANTTGDVLRAALRVVGVKTGNKTVSSFFIMSTNKKEIGTNGYILFADCAVNPDPTAEQLADIAISTAENCKIFLNTEPKVAMLSFSTKGSAESASTKKVLSALGMVNERASNILADGEMQLDAAIIPSVGERKAPGSFVAGRANVLIFPDLNAGNIGYKLVERFADALAIGPVIQGLAKPMNDLSRGADVADIVNMVAVTSVGTSSN